MQTETVYHIITHMAGRKKYISEHHVRHADNRIIPGLSENVADAKEYPSEAHAQRIIKDSIFDNFNRTWLVEPRQVPKARSKKFTHFKHELQ